MLKKLILQLLPIALGVYLGIWAGNLNERNKSKKDQKHFIENVVKELEINKSKLKRSVDYHSALKESLDSVIFNMDRAQLNEKFFETGGFQKLPNWTGTGIASLSRNVYITGLNTNVMSDLDFKTSSLISGIYTGLDNYKEFTDPIMERMLFSLNYDSSNKDVYFLLELIKSDVLGSEKRIIEKLNQAIEKLKEEIR